MNIKSILAATLLAVGTSISAAPAIAGNPADEAGEQHNIYLDCLFKANATGTGIPKALIESCGYDPSIPDEEFIKYLLDFLEIEDQPLSVVMEPVRDQYTDYEFAFFGRMDEIGLQAASFAEADAKLGQLEEEAVAKLDPKSHSGRIILGGLSVSRHSVRFWRVFAEQYANAQQGGRIFAKTKKKELTTRDWMKIAMADVDGFIQSDGSIPAAAAKSKKTFERLTR